MWEHQHVNDNPNPIKQLRIAFGIRTWFTSVWPKGFTNHRIYDKYAGGGERCDGRRP
jgi:hypothetical protein